MHAGYDKQLNDQHHMWIELRMTWLSLSMEEGDLGGYASGEGRPLDA